MFIHCHDLPTREAGVMIELIVNKWSLQNFIIPEIYICGNRVANMSVSLLFWARYDYLDYATKRGNARKDFN